ncbi:MAG TPA: cation diffusion facilitator family transporter [Gammaproteobacteria bacterium]|nr:cation diffusion facilitator family transporter [Gammaproteobacteria bacterium]
MSSSRKLVIYAALTGNTLIAVMKFIAASITGSSAMFSEGIHSVVDTGNQVLLLNGLKQARKPADERFPFGHGKEIYFWSFVVAILIFAVGAGISIYEGIHRLSDPTPLENILINYIVLGLAIVFEGGAWYFALREFKQVKGNLGYIEAVKQGKDPTMFVVLFEDSAAMLGLLIALVATFLSDSTGNLYLDGIASIIIGLILAGTATWLALETKSLLIGESANPQIVDGIKELVQDYNNIEHVSEVLTMHMGPEYILANLSVDFSDEATASEVEETISELDAAIKNKYENVKRIFIEAEAWHSNLQPQPPGE